MISTENKHHSTSTEESDENNSNSKDSKIELDLNLKNKSGENCFSNYFKETESLKYNSCYKAIFPDTKNDILRKSSNISTAVSQSDNVMDNSSPQNNYQDYPDTSFFNINRERFSSTPISNYYDGTDNYLKGLYPEKNDYQKSNNYLEKRIFFREHYPSVDIGLMYKKKQNMFFPESENTEKTNIISPPPMPVSNPQTPKNIEKNEFPLFFMGYCGLPRFNSKNKFINYL